MRNFVNIFCMNNIPTYNPTSTNFYAKHYNFYNK